MTIHSFGAGAVWPTSNATTGKPRPVAPYPGGRSAGDIQEPPPPPGPPRGGPGKGFREIPPPVGVSHPREWAVLMGLPVPDEQASPGKP